MKNFLNKYLPIFLSAVLISTAGFFWFTQTVEAVAVFDKHNITLSPNGNDITSAALDTSNDTLLVVIETNDAGATATISDSKGNTWHGLTTITGTAGFKTRIWYAYDHGGSPLSIGTGHTFSLAAGNAGYASMEVLTFQGTQTSSDPFDVQNTHNQTSTNLSFNTGSITPSVNGEVIIAANGNTDLGAATHVTIDSSMTISDQSSLITGQNYGSGAAYLIQSTAGAINPTWTTNNGAQAYNAGIASFKAASAAASTPPHAQIILNNAQAIINKGQVIIQ